MFKPLCFVENFLNSCRSLRCAETAKQNNPEIAEQLLCIIFQVHLVRDDLRHPQVQARCRRRRGDEPGHDLLVRLRELPHGGGAVQGADGP